MTLQTIVHQVPLSTGFFRQEYWSGLPFPPPGDLPNPGIKHLLCLLHCRQILYLLSHLGSPEIESKSLSLYIRTHIYIRIIIWPSISLLGIYSKVSKAETQTFICSIMFITKLDNNWKVDPSVHEQISGKIICGIYIQWNMINKGISDACYMDKRWIFCGKWTQKEKCYTSMRYDSQIHLDRK